jgi:hypothetical protein
MVDPKRVSVIQCNVTESVILSGRYRGVCVESLIGKQKKPILFKITEPSSIPYRTPPACAKMAAYPDPPPVTVRTSAIKRDWYKSFCD